MAQHTKSFERFCSQDAMYDASYKVCRNVRWKDSTIEFEENRLETIWNTQNELQDGDYEQLIFSSFSIVERGKPRDIRACHIKDRMVQNALCETVLLPITTPRFIYDNCATLKDRGIDFAFKRFKHHLQAANREYKGQDFYCLRIDIRKYFDSIDHASLKRLVDEMIKEKDIQEICHYLISTFSYKLTHDSHQIKGKQYFIASNGRYIPHTGNRFLPNKKYYEYEEKSLGLGSQSSQLFALLALNKVDHYVKEQLHIKYYGRYMDDIYLLHKDSEYLRQCQKSIGIELSKIGLSFNSNKTVITKIHPIGDDKVRKAPIKYLKWNFYITESGHIIMIPFKKKLAQQRRKLRKLKGRLERGEITIKDIQISYQGWRANMKKGTTFYVIQDMDNYFRSLFKGVDIL